MELLEEQRRTDERIRDGFRQLLAEKQRERMVPGLSITCAGALGNADPDLEHLRLRLV
jgi:hypothetical protein